MANKQIEPVIFPATFLYRFVLLLAPLVVLFLTISLFIYHLETANHRELVANKEKVVVRTGLQLIHDTIDPIQADLGFLAEICSNNLLQAQNKHQSKAAIKRLEDIFLSLAKNHPVYDQVRLLDKNGMEQIRVNFGEDVPVVVPPELLQDKGKRYYFWDTIQLKKGEVFISPLDLNIENREIEYPLKPMLRVGQVVVDNQGNKLGAVILNYKGQEMLDKIHNWALTQPGDLMLLNSEGYWLHGKNREQEWGFMFPGRKSFCLKTIAPDLWNNSIDGGETGQVTTEDGLFTFTTVRPLRKGYVSSTGSASATGKSSRILNGDDYYWKIVSQVPTAALDSSIAELKRNFRWAIIAGVLLIGGFSGVLTMAQIRKKMADLALRQANEQLEHKVTQRTEELSERNSQLEVEIDRRVLTENALAMSEERYRAIMESMDDDVYVTSSDYQVIYANPNLERRLFDDRSFCYTALYNRQSPCPWCKISEVLSGQKVIYELQSPNDGKIYHISNTPISYQEDNKGKLTIARDISEVRRTQHALATSERRNSTLLENMREGVVVIDRKGLISYCNNQFAQMLGYSVEEVIGCEYGAFLDEDNNKIVQQQLILRKSNITTSYELIWQQKNRTPLLTEISPSVLRNEKGEFTGSFGLVTDITKQKVAEEERKSLENQLLQAQKMESIGTLAGGIAHDFNNILSAILGYTELAIARVQSDKNLVDDLREVYSAGIRAKDLVQQILAFSRQSEETMKPIQIDIIVREVLKLIRSSTPTTIEIRQNITCDSIIMGNTIQIHQIMMNLCTNAVHAMEKSGGILGVALQDVSIDALSPMINEGLQPAEYVRIKVSDSGTGIAPDAIKSIFDPYYTTKAQGEGTGLGLSLVHGIVEKSGGKVRVESQLGIGTTFSVYLPITKKRQVQQSFEQEELPKGIERILFVDDEAPLARIGGRVFESLGYTVTIRTSSIEALELFKSKSKDFDLIITDMTMPNMSGDALAIECMAVRPDIPIILCTGYSKKISAESASEIGFKAFIYKPFVKKDLAETVRGVLDLAKD
ncbi:hybrid sensor histidine kinase/response regulator [Desulforhopalus sp. 52FAK]